MTSLARPCRMSAVGRDDHASVRQRGDVQPTQWLHRYGTRRLAKLLAGQVHHVEVESMQESNDLDTDFLGENEAFLTRLW